MSKHPVVSVLMSVFNGEHHLAVALESVLEQTFADFEFIVIDDGSTDSTWEILADYASRHSRMRLLRHDSNMGLTRALNRGLEMARGRYVARQDADDISLPERFSRQLGYLKLHPDIGLLGTGTRAVTQAGTIKWTIRPPVESMLIGWRLLFESCFAHSSVMFRSSVLRKTGPYAEDFVYAQDFELWSRMSAHTKLANLPEVLVHRCIGPHSMSTSRAREQSLAAARVIQGNSSRLSGRDVPFVVACNVHRVTRGEALTDANAILEVASLVRRLLAVYLHAANPDAVTSRLIRHDAASKLYLLAGQNLKTSRRACMRTIWQAEEIDARLPSLRTLTSMIRQYLGKNRAETALSDASR